MRPRAQEAAKRSSANRKGQAAGGTKGGKGRLRCQLPLGPASGLSLWRRVRRAWCWGSVLVSLGEQETTRGTGKHEPSVSTNLALVRAQTVTCGISREVKCAASTPKTVLGGAALVTMATAFHG